MQPVQFLWLLCAICCYATSQSVLPTYVAGVPKVLSIFEDSKFCKTCLDYGSDSDAVSWKFQHLTASTLPNKSEISSSYAEAIVEEAHEIEVTGRSYLEAAVNGPVALMLLSFVGAGAIIKRWLSISSGKPIKQTGGALGRLIPWCHTVLCMYAQLFQFTMTLRWGVAGSLLAMLYQFCVCVVIDGIISDAPWENLRSLRRNGFEDWQVAASLVTCQVVWGSNSLWAWYFVPTFEVSFSWSAMLSLVLSLILAETVFTSLHVLMHQYTFFDAWVGDEGWVHKFHHCCLSPSMSSNYVFSVVDGIIESHGPWLAAWSVYMFIMKDPWGLWLSLYVIQQWYLLDHDENIQTHHYRHHKYIDAEYNAYSPIKMKSVPDKLRMKVKRSDRA